MKLAINRKKILEKCIRRGLTIGKLAQAAQVNIKTLHRIIECEKEPRIDTLAKIAKALDVDPMDIAVIEDGYIVNPICTRVKAIRQELGLTQAMFATPLGVSNSHICGIEKDKKTPSDTLIKLICKEYFISENWFRNGIGPMMQKDKDAVIEEAIAIGTNGIAEQRQESPSDADV